LMLTEWSLLRRLRGNALYPVALVIAWFSFVLLFPGMASGLTGYENFVINAYFWILLGVLFSLPAISGQGFANRNAREALGER